MGARPPETQPQDAVQAVGPGGVESVRLQEMPTPSLLRAAHSPSAVGPAIREAQAAGAKSLREIAAALNARGVATARGGRWKRRRWRTSFVAWDEVAKGCVAWSDQGPLVTDSERLGPDAWSRRDTWN